MYEWRAVDLKKHTNLRLRVEGKQAGLTQVNLTESKDANHSSMVLLQTTAWISSKV